MLDRIPERLRTAAEGVERATQMMADAKSRRNQAAEGGDWPGYLGLKREQTAEWQAADLIEQLFSALKQITMMARTSGGVAGRDEALCAACDVAEAAIASASRALNQEEISDAT